MTSDEFFKTDQKFDFIYIDGDHRYTQAKKDIENALQHLNKGGIICGDDLDYLSSEIDENEAEAHKEEDFFTDTKGRTYHAGVTLAIRDVFNNNVNSSHSIWWIENVI